MTMSDSEAVINLRQLLRERQDGGQLPLEAAGGRRFQVLATEIAIPMLRNLVMTLCLEGLTVHLLLALDETPPYIGIQIEQPAMTLCVWPSPDAQNIIVSAQGGLYPNFRSDRSLTYRGLTLTTLESLCVEQLRLVLCPPRPIL